MKDLTDWGQALYALVPLMQESGTSGGGIGDGFHGEGWSIGIFVFLIICIMLFTGIIFGFMVTAKGKLKGGEKLLFIWLLLGVGAATVFAALQLLQGRLF